MQELIGLTTIRDFVRWGVSRFHQEGLFFGHGSDNAWDEARLLVLHALYLPWETPENYLDCHLAESERNLVVALLNRRIEQRIPASYLTGHARFAGYDFLIDERVLVPRSPIAEMIANRFEPWLEREIDQTIELTSQQFLSARGFEDVTDDRFYNRSAPADSMIWNQLLTGGNFGSIF